MINKYSRVNFISNYDEYTIKLSRSSSGIVVGLYLLELRFLGDTGDRFGQIPVLICY